MCCTVNSELYAVFFACTAGWLAGWLATLVLHCMNFELWPRAGYTFTLWCMQGNQAPQYVSRLITNYHFSFFTYCMSTIRQRKEFSYNRPGICLLMSSVWAGKIWTTTLGGMCSISGLKLGHTALTQGRLQWKLTFPNLVFWLSMGPNNCHSMSYT